MAKGKHAPAQGATRDKVLHPSSRKVKKIQKQEIHRFNVENKSKQGVQRMVSTAEQFAWYKENLLAVCEDEEQITPEKVIQLVDGFLSRFDEELEQIKLKNSVGGKNKRRQHAAREDLLQHLKKTEKTEFEGCGLEMPDWFDPVNYQYFKSWSGEVRFLQNIKTRRFSKKQLLEMQSNLEQESTMETT